MRIVRPTQRSSHAKDATQKGAEGPGAPLHDRALHPGSDDLICPAKAQPGEHQQSPHLQQHLVNTGGRFQGESSVTTILGCFIETRIAQGMQWLQLRPSHPPIR